MASFLMVRLCLLSLTTARLQSLDSLMMFAVAGDDVSLPCEIPSITSCSSVNWIMAGEFGSIIEVVKAGRVEAPNTISLQKDCSLVVNHLELNDARLYTCDSGAFSASISLQILELTESLIPMDGTIELQCFLNTYMGYVPCHNRGIHIEWSTEDNTPLQGDRFHFESPSECFSKLIINKKLTDHHRKWKCQLFLNNTIKATISYATTVEDGVEEVFTAVGESVSLTCGNTSLVGGRSVEWTLRGRTDDILPFKDQTETFHMNKDSSLFISKVSAVHAGEYQCSESIGQQKVVKTIRLHILDVISEYEPGKDNLTLTCVLTCAKICERYFNLIWSGNNQSSWRCGESNDNGTLRNNLCLSVLSETSEEFTCSVHREGDLVVSKKWRMVNSLQTAAWTALILGLLICVVALGLYMYIKRRHKDAGAESGTDLSSIGMIHINDSYEDAYYEEPHHQRETKQEATSFYDLLQAVNKN
ncbi:uncharacterized protein [Antennarius striatus]|uniref:uncharacterized protein isoform X2 n=1 Tax=Antennarius striatus TaxID=241820 RepID=UPI0035B08569